MKLESLVYYYIKLVKDNLRNHLKPKLDILDKIFSDFNNDIITMKNDLCKLVIESNI